MKNSKEEVPLHEMKVEREKKRKKERKRGREKRKKIKGNTLESTSSMKF